jgi:hypothetical protein
VDYCISMVWQVGSFGGLVESQDHNNMLCGKFPILWMDFQWIVMVSCDGCNSGALAWMRWLRVYVRLTR